MKLSDIDNGIGDWLRKQMDMDMGRINGIPIVPGRPWPFRPPVQYRPKRRIIAFRNPYGRSEWFEMMFKHRACGPTLDLWPAQVRTLSSITEKHKARPGWSQP